MEKTTLLTCPCCGAEASVRNDGYWMRPHFVACKNCGLATKGYKTETEAKRKWNERTK